MLPGASSLALCVDVLKCCSSHYCTPRDHHSPPKITHPPSCRQPLPHQDGVQDSPLRVDPHDHLWARLWGRGHLGRGVQVEGQAAQFR